jgi:AraC-like DNA-binding protein
MVIHAGPDMPLDREVIGGDMWRYAVIHYRIPQEEIAGASLYDKYFPIHTGLNARLTELVEQQLQTCNIPGGLAALRSKTIFAILMEELILSAQRQLQDGSTEAMVKAAEYMRIHFAEPLSVAQLAMQFGFNRRRFAYLFEKQTGMSPGFYLGECRIRRSKELLRTCDSSVAVIAEAVGYADSFYFSRYFKKQTGLSPTEYRKQFRNRS